MAEYLVRINPASQRRKMIIRNGGKRQLFEQAGGWYGPIGEALALRLREVPENELNPLSDSRRVFEVKEVEAAKVVARAERRVEKPKGTPETPRKVDDDEGKTQTASTGQTEGQGGGGESGPPATTQGGGTVAAGGRGGRGGRGGAGGGRTAAPAAPPIETAKATEGDGQAAGGNPPTGEGQTAGGNPQT